MAQAVKVAVAQFASEPGAVAENRRRSLQAIAAAAAQGARCVVLPELCQSGYDLSPAAARAAAEDAERGETVQAWVAAARRWDCYVAGGLCERAEPRPYNSAVLVGPQGVVGVYRKVHLFDREQDAFAAGDALPVFTLPWARVGLEICYDLRFPEATGVLARRGAQLVLVPTAWVTLTGRGWDAHGFCIQAYGAMALAAMNRVYLACADTTGRFRDGEFLAASLIVGPDGWPLAGPAPPGTTVLTAVVEPARAEDKAIGPRNHVVRDRRPEVYAAWDAAAGKG